MRTQILCFGTGLLGRRLLLLISALFVWFGLRLQADQWGSFTYNREGDEIVITAYLGTERVVTIPEAIEGLPVTTLKTSEWWGGARVTVLRLPASLTSLRGTFPFPWSESLQWIDVAPGNSVFSSRDGVLYSRDQSRLIRCPVAWPGDQFIVPDTVTRIEADAFGGCRNLIQVGIPASVKELGDGAFDNRQRSCGWGYRPNCFTVGQQMDLYFAGDAPIAGLPFGYRSDVPSDRDSSQPPRIFHRAIAAGWQSTYGGIATIPWQGEPAILIQPKPVFGYRGSVAGLSVQAFGPGPLHYRWLRPPAEAPVATDPVVALSPLRMDDAGAWQVVVSNTFGALTSRVATVSVRQPMPGSHESAVLALGPMAYWPMDEIHGATLGEFVGGAHGSLEDGTGEYRPDPPGATASPGAGIDFQGSVWATVSPGVAPRLTTGDFTVVAWIYPTSSSTGVLAARYAEYIPWDYGNAVWHRGWTFSSHEQRLSFRATSIQYCDRGSVESPLGVVTLDEWQQVVVSCRRDPAVTAGSNPTGNDWTKIYRNGRLVASGDIGTGDLDNPDYPLTLGGAPFWGFHGRMKDVALYSRALSAEEISGLYAASTVSLPTLQMTRSSTGVTLTWSTGVLQSASTLGDGKSGPDWKDLPEATSPFTLGTTSSAGFFRVRMP